MTFGTPVKKVTYDTAKIAKNIMSLDISKLSHDEAERIVNEIPLRKYLHMLECGVPEIEKQYAALQKRAMFRTQEELSELIPDTPPDIICDGIFNDFVREYKKEGQ